MNNSVFDHRNPPHNQLYQINQAMSVDEITIFNRGLGDSYIMNHNNNNNNNNYGKNQISDSRLLSSIGLSKELGSNTLIVSPRVKRQNQFNINQEEKIDNSFIISLNIQRDQQKEIPVKDTHNIVQINKEAHTKQKINFQARPQWMNDQSTEFLYNPAEYSQTSMQMICPNCQKLIKTVVTYQPTPKTMTVSCLLCLCGFCCLLCLIPYCWQQNFQTVIHTCPLCQIYIAKIEYK